MKEESKEKSILRELGSWLLYLLFALMFSYLIITYVGQRTRVDGQSMETTLYNNDNLLVDKLSYRFRDPKRFEIVVFPYQYRENTYYIKRIIGLPGETVQVIDGYVYIDGEQLDEHYGNELMENPGIAAEPLMLGEDQYFVLGDNRNHSSDSRDARLGPVKRGYLQGKALLLLTPGATPGTEKRDWGRIGPLR